jgi:hypothetical protein
MLFYCDSDNEFTPESASALLGVRPSLSAPTKSRSNMSHGQGTKRRVSFADVVHTAIYLDEPEESEDDIDKRDEIPRAPPPCSARRIASVQKWKGASRVGGVVLSGPRNSSEDCSIFIGTARPLARLKTLPSTGVPFAASSEKSSTGGAGRPS